MRVWDIAQDNCVSKYSYEFSIISLAFHPGGDIIGVATGPQLHMWDWKRSCKDEFRDKYDYSPYFDEDLRPITEPNFIIRDPDTSGSSSSSSISQVGDGIKSSGTYTVPERC